MKMQYYRIQYNERLYTHDNDNTTKHTINDMVKKIKGVKSLNLRKSLGNSKIVNTSSSLLYIKKGLFLFFKYRDLQVFVIYFEYFLNKVIIGIENLGVKKYNVLSKRVQKVDLIVD